jgi:hypothetical protein
VKVTGPLSRHYDQALVVAPERRGEVAWGQFNRHYHRLQHDHWSTINRGTDHPWYRRLKRLAMAWFIQRTGGFLDLRRKAKVISRFDLPRDPDVVFFGAEVGWEAVLVQALFGDGGRVVLVDCDPEAYQRFLDAPTEMVVKAPRGLPGRELVLRRDPDRIEYVQEDFFDWCEPEAFDVGIDWGLLEHFPGDRKLDVMKRFQACLRPGGHQISAVPRDAMSTRSFYKTFPDELNFGYRELMTMAELADLLERGGFELVQRVTTPTTCIALGTRSG